MRLSMRGSVEQTYCKNNLAPLRENMPKVGIKLKIVWGDI